MNKSFRVIKRIVIALCIVLGAFVLESCDFGMKEPAKPGSQGKNIETVSGIVSLPESVSLSLDSFYVKVVDNEGKTLKVEKTKADGSFIISLPAGTYDLYFSSVESDFNNYTKDISKAGSYGYGCVVYNVVSSTESETNLGVVIQKPLGTISGYVKLLGSKSHEGVHVSIPGTAFSAVTDASGKYEIYNVPYGVFDLSISYPLYEKADVKDIKLIASSSEHPVVRVPEVKLRKPLGAIDGKVLLSGTGLLAGTKVVLEKQGMGIYDSAVTAAEGDFSFSSLPSGIYALVIRHDGFKSQRIADIDVSAGMTNDVGELLLLRETGSILGHISLSSGIAEEIGLELESYDGSRHYYTTASDSNDYQFLDIPVGSYKLYVSAAGYGSSVYHDVNISKGGESLRIENITLFPAVRSITGTATLEDVSYHSFIKVVATSTTDPSVVDYAYTDSKGNYTFSGLSEGEYRLEFIKNGYSTAVLPSVDVRGSDAFDLEPIVLLSSKGFITGSLELEGRSDFSGVEVSLVGTEYSAFTDVDGIYSIAVPVGHYTGGLRFRHDYYGIKSVSGTFDITDGNEIGVDEVLLKARYADVKGRVIVEGLDTNEGVEVTIAGQSVVTGSDGNFFFRRIPLGLHDVRCEKQSVPVLVRPLSVIPSYCVNMGILRLYPDSASIHGRVELDGMDVHGDIDVTVVTEGGKENKFTLTDDGGYFSISNLPVPAKHTVFFNKEGWICRNSIVVEDLSLLEDRCITEGLNIILVDEDAPVISSVTINGGDNFTNDSCLNINIDASDMGSGITEMKLSWEGDDTLSGWVPFEDSFTASALPTGNGDRKLSVVVRDRAGNESVAVSDSITLTDQYTIVDGYLHADQLHWTADKSPYFVDGYIWVNSGDTLVIDPGVDVLFLGDYWIDVDGILEAVGTEKEPISFRTAGGFVPDGYMEYHGSWNRINCTSNYLSYEGKGREAVLTNGSIMKHCIINDISDGIHGYIHVEDSSITSTYRAFCNHYGSILRTKASGEVWYNYGVGNSIVCDNQFISNPGRWDYLCISSNTFENNLVSDYRYVRMGNGGESYPVRFNTFKDCGYEWFNAYDASFNEFDGVGNPIEMQDSRCHFNFNNFNGSNLSVLFNCNYDVDLRYNWWGVDNTNELMSYTSLEDADVSFIYDLHDNLSGVADLTGFAPQKYPDIGYSGNSRNQLKVVIDSNQPVGVDRTFRFEADADIAEYRIANDITFLFDSIWKPYTAEGIIPAELLDGASLTSQGYSVIYVQSRTFDGSISSIAVVETPYSAPMISFNGFSAGHVLTGNDCYNLDLNVVSPYAIESTRIKMDGKYYDRTWMYAYEFKNGEHFLDFEVVDAVGNVAALHVPFVIDRPVVEIVSTDFEPGMLISNMDLYSFNLELTRAEYLRKVELLEGERVLQTHDLYYGSYEYSLSFELQGQCLTVGEHELSLRFTDSLGNEMVHVLGNIQVDGLDAAPVIGGLTLEDGTLFGIEDRIMQTIECYDDNGIKSVLVYLNDELIHENSCGSYSPDRSHIKTEFALDIFNMTNGHYDLSVIVSDFTGMESVERRSFDVYHDLLSLNCEFINTFDTFKVKCSIDGTDKLKRISVIMDGVNLYTRNGRDLGYMDYSYVIDLDYPKESLPAGNHTVYAVAEDVHGNMLYSESYTFDIYRYSDGEYGLGRTWNADGTLKVDGNTRLLLSFERPDCTFYDSALGHSIYSENYGFTESASIGIGALNGYSPTVEREIDFNGNNYTVETWLRCDADYYQWLNVEFSGLCSLYGQIPDNGGDFYIYWNVINDDSSYSIGNLHYDNDFLKQWHHMALVYEDGTAKAYVDGILVGSLEGRVSAGRMWDLNFNLDSQYCLDELRISDKARSQDEIYSYVQYVRELLGY